MKKCKSCKKEFEPRSMKHICCSYDCAIKHANILSNKLAEKKRKATNKETRDKIKSLGDYKRELQTQVNLIARLIDEGCPCVSSGRLSGKMNGGHRFAVGGWDSLRFNLFNIWIQSFSDNHHKSGNPHGYDKFLTENGLYEYVHDLPQFYPLNKLTKDDLKEKIHIAKNAVWNLKELNQAEQLPRTIERRIFLRKNINGLLGIYK
jgi:hypothetical protein